MLVQAPVSGMLSSFNTVIGETYGRNEMVVKLDVQSGFKIKGQVETNEVGKDKGNSNCDQVNCQNQPFTRKSCCSACKIVLNHDTFFSIIPTTLSS